MVAVETGFQAVVEVLQRHITQAGQSATQFSSEESVTHAPQLDYALHCQVFVLARKLYDAWPTLPPACFTSCIDLVYAYHDRCLFHTDTPAYWLTAERLPVVMDGLRQRSVWWYLAQAASPGLLAFWDQVSSELGQHPDHHAWACRLLGHEIPANQPAAFTLPVTENRTGLVCCLDALEDIAECSAVYAEAKEGHWPTLQFQALNGGLGRLSAMFDVYGFADESADRQTSQRLTQVTLLWQETKCVLALTWPQGIRLTDYLFTETVLWSWAERLQLVQRLRQDLERMLTTGWVHGNLHPAHLYLLEQPGQSPSDFVVGGWLNAQPQGTYVPYLLGSDARYSTAQHAQGCETDNPWSATTISRFDAYGAATIVLALLHPRDLTAILTPPNDDEPDVARQIQFYHAHRLASIHQIGHPALEAWLQTAFRPLENRPTLADWLDQCPLGQ